MARALKTCPECGQTNGFMDERCACGHDLAGVQPMVPGLPQAEAQVAAAEDAAGDATIEVGPESLAEAPPASTGAPATPPLKPAPAKASTGDQTLVLELVADPRVRFQVHSGQTVGRGRDADVQLIGFQVPDDISRVHVEFERRRTGWFVRHVGRTNFIQIEGRQHRDPSLQVPLADGTVLSLTTTPFVVRLGT